MTSHSDLPTLPSGRKVEDILVRQWESCGHTFRALKLSTGWHLIWVSKNGSRRCIAVDRPTLEELQEQCVDILKENLQADIAKMTKMLEEYDQ